MRLSVETLIDAPRERVFARLLDVTRWPETIRGIESVELLTPGPIAVGSRIRETRHMHGRKASEVMTLAEIEKPARLVLTAENHGTRYRVMHLLKAEGGATRLGLHLEGEPVTLLARLFIPLAWLMRGVVKRQLAADLADLKQALERDSGAAP